MRKTIAILLLVTGVSCSRQETAQLTIFIDKSGQLSLQSPVSLEDLRIHLSRQYARLGNFPVYIQSEDNVPFKRAYEVWRVCSDIGLWNVLLCDGLGKPVLTVFPPWEEQPKPDGIKISAPGEITITCAANARFRDMLDILRACETMTITNYTLRVTWGEPETND